MSPKRLGHPAPTDPLAAAPLAIVPSVPIDARLVPASWLQPELYGFAGTGLYSAPPQSMDPLYFSIYAEGGLTIRSGRAARWRGFDRDAFYDKGSMFWSRCF